MCKYIYLLLIKRLCIKMKTAKTYIKFGLGDKKQDKTKMYFGKNNKQKMCMLVMYKNVQLKIKKNIYIKRLNKTSFFILLKKGHLQHKM